MAGLEGLIKAHEAEQIRIAREARESFRTSAIVDPLGRHIGPDTQYDTDPDAPAVVPGAPLADLGSIPVAPAGDRPLPPIAPEALPPLAPAPPPGVVAPTPGGTGGPAGFAPILEQPAGLSREARAAIAAEQVAVADQIARAPAPAPAGPAVPPAPTYQEALALNDAAVPAQVVDAAADTAAKKADWVRLLDRWVSQELVGYTPQWRGSNGILEDMARTKAFQQAAPEDREALLADFQPPGAGTVLKNRMLGPFANIGGRPESTDVEAADRGRQVGAVVTKLRGHQALTPEEADLWRVTQRQVVSHLELPDTVDLVGFGTGAGLDLGAAVKKAESARYMRLLDEGVASEVAAEQAARWADVKLQEALRPGGVLRGVPLYVNSPVADFGGSLFDAAQRLAEDRKTAAATTAQLLEPYLGDSEKIPLAIELMHIGQGAAEYGLVTVAKAIPQTRLTSTGDVGAAVTKLEGPLMMLARAISIEDAAWGAVVTRTSPGSPEVREFLLANRGGVDSGQEIARAASDVYGTVGFEALARSMQYVPEPIRGVLALAAWAGPMLGPFQTLARAAEAYEENPENPSYYDTVAFPTLAGAGTALVASFNTPDAISLGAAGVDIARVGPRVKQLLLNTALGRKVAPYVLDMDPGRIIIRDVIAAAEKADIQTDADISAVAGQLFNTPGVGDVAQRVVQDRLAAATRDVIGDLGVRIDSSLEPGVLEGAKAEKAVRLREDEALAQAAKDVVSKVADARVADQAAVAAAQRAQAALDAAPTAPESLLAKRGATLHGRVLSPDTVAEAAALADRVAEGRFPLNVSEGLRRLYRGVLDVEAPDKSARELALEISAAVPLFRAPPTGGLTAAERGQLGRMLLVRPGTKGVGGDPEVAARVTRWFERAAGFAGRLGLPPPPALPLDLLNADAADMAAWWKATDEFAGAARRRVMATTGLQDPTAMGRMDVEARGLGGARAPQAGDVYLEEAADRWIRVDPASIATIRAAVGGPQPPPPGVEVALRAALSDVGAPNTGSLPDALASARKVLGRVVDAPGPKLAESLRLTEEIAKHQAVLRAAAAAVAPGAKIPTYNAGAVALASTAAQNAFQSTQAAGAALQTAAQVSGRAVTKMRAVEPLLAPAVDSFITAARDTKTALSTVQRAGRGIVRAAKQRAEQTAEAPNELGRILGRLLPTPGEFVGPGGARPAEAMSDALLALAGRSRTPSMPAAELGARLDAGVREALRQGVPLRKTLDLVGPPPAGSPGLVTPGDLRALTAIEVGDRITRLRVVSLAGTPAEVTAARDYFDNVARRLLAQQRELDALEGAMGALRAAVARKKLTAKQAEAQAVTLIANFKKAGRAPLPGDATAAVAATVRAAQEAAQEVATAGESLARAAKAAEKAAVAHVSLASHAAAARRGHDVTQARDAIRVAVARRRDLARDAGAAQRDLLEALTARDTAHEVARKAEAAVDLGAKRKDILLGALRDVLASADAWDAYRAKHPGAVLLASAMSGGVVDYDRLRARILRVAPPEVLRDWAVDLAGDAQEVVQDILAGGKKPLRLGRHQTQAVLDDLVAFAEAQVPGLPEYVYGAAADLAARDPFIVQPRKGFARLLAGVARFNDPIAQMQGQLSEKAFDLYRGTQTFLGMAVGELDALRKEVGVDFAAAAGRYLTGGDPLEYHVGGNLLPGQGGVSRVVNAATRRLGTVTTVANRGRNFWAEAVTWITANPEAAGEIKVASGLFRAYIPDAYTPAAGTQADKVLEAFEGRMLRVLRDNPGLSWDDFLKTLRKETKDTFGGVTSRDVRAFSIAAENVIYAASAAEFTNRARTLFAWAPYTGDADSVVTDARHLVNRVHQLLGGRGKDAAAQPRTVMRDLEEALGLLNAWGKGVTSGTMRFPDEAGGQSVEVLVRFSVLTAESGGVIVPMHLLENLTRRALVKDAEKYPGSSAGAGIRAVAHDVASIAKSLVMTGGFLFRYGHLGGLIHGDFGTIWNESGIVTAGRVAATNLVAAAPVVGILAAKVQGDVARGVAGMVRAKQLPPAVGISASGVVQAILQGKATEITLAGAPARVADEVRHMMDTGVFETSFQQDLSSAVKTDAERWYGGAVDAARVREADVARLRQSALVRGLSPYDAQVEAEEAADLLAAERAAAGNPGKAGRALSAVKQIAKSRMEQTRALAEEIQRRQRMAYYLILRDEGATPAQAGKAVREAQLDYANGITRWEQSHWLPKIGMWYRWWRLTLTQTARIAVEPATVGFGQKLLDGTARFPRLVDQINGVAAIPGVIRDWYHEDDNAATKAQYAFAEHNEGPLAPGRHLFTKGLSREDRTSLLGAGYGEVDGLRYSMPAFSAIEAMTIFVDTVVGAAHLAHAAVDPNVDFDSAVAEVLANDFMSVLLTGPYAQALIKHDSFQYDWPLNPDQVALTKMLGVQHLVNYNAEGQPTLPGWAVWMQGAFLSNFALGSVPRFLGTYNFAPESMHPLQRVALATTATFGLQIGGVNSRGDAEKIRKKMLADIVQQAEAETAKRRNRPK